VTLAAGSTAALVGENGSGKNTLVKLTVVWSTPSHAAERARAA
jgi:ABC-type Mn2+/Zn2+ transport system ATPase subunit